MKLVCDHFHNCIFEVVRKWGPRGKIETFGDHLGTSVLTIESRILDVYSSTQFFFREVTTYIIAL